ncbi:hypothetical protein ACFXTN_043198 [Malus domestica]
MTQESFIYNFVAQVSPEASFLQDEGIPVIAEKIATLVKAANVHVESYWPGLFAKLYGKRNIEDLVLNAGSGDAVSIAAPGVAEAAAPTAAAPQHIFLFLPPRSEPSRKVPEPSAPLDLKRRCFIPRAVPEASKSPEAYPLR